MITLSRKNARILTLLKNVGAIIMDDHFVYTSGMHGSVYINKDALYPHVMLFSEVGKMFARKYKYVPIDVVAAPALGGIVLSQWTAYYLTKITKKPVLGIFSEKSPENTQVFTRGYHTLIKRKNVLVLEDLTTTGGSVKKVVDAVRHEGGNVVAVCAMVNRNPKKVTSQTVGAPFSSLGIVQADAVDEKSCHLCKRNIPINTQVGHGKKYLARKANQSTQ